LVSKKTKTSWSCNECGYLSINFLGRCPKCGAWSSFIEKKKVDSILGLDQKNNKAQISFNSIFSRSSQSDRPFENRALELSEVEFKEKQTRLKTGFRELDKILGGGVQRGSLTLIAGDPGIGKSTLLLQLSGEILRQKLKVFYVSGEESPEQVKQRAVRLKINQELLFLSETNLELISEQIKDHSPDLLIIDSIQSIYSEMSSSFPGSPSQIRECTALLLQIAKNLNITVILVGHINKEGNIAGPKLLEHMVDTVLYFEGGKDSSLRILRTNKNRFGPTEEITMFELSGKGLLEVLNPSSIFLSDLSEKLNKGTSITPSLKGSKVILTEIQALTSFTAYAYPKRLVNGLDYNRVNQLVAILDKRANLNLGKQDVYANVIGGFNIIEPASDLALCLSIVSCRRNLFPKSKSIILGEVGLSGEVRSITNLQKRLQESEKLGFLQAIVPVNNLKNLQKSNLEKKLKIRIIGVNSLDQAIDAYL